MLDDIGLKLSKLMEFRNQVRYSPDGQGACRAFALSILLLSAVATSEAAQPATSPQLTLISVASPQPNPTSILSNREREELERLREEKRIRDLVEKSIGASAVVRDRVQSEVDRAFDHITTILNTLLIVLTLFPIIAAVGVWLLRRSVISQIVSETKADIEKQLAGEIAAELQKQTEALRQEIESLKSNAISQLESVISESQNVLVELRNQRKFVEQEIEMMRADAAHQMQNLVSDVQKEKDEMLQELYNLIPNSIQEKISPENLEKIKDVMDHLEALESANPNIRLSAKDYARQGTALYYEHRYDDAVASYDKAIEIKPDYCEVWNNRGIALNELQRYTEAIVSYDKALEINPDFYEAWSNLGNAVARLQRYQEAIKCYNKAIQIQPNDPSIWYHKASCYALQGNIDLAIENLRQAIKLNPQYKQMAKTDLNFDAIRKDERFKNLIDG